MLEMCKNHLIIIMTLMSLKWRKFPPVAMDVQRAPSELSSFNLVVAVHGEENFHFCHLVIEDER